MTMTAPLPTENDRTWQTAIERLAADGETIHSLTVDYLSYDADGTLDTDHVRASKVADILRDLDDLDRIAAAYRDYGAHPFDGVTGVYAASLSARAVALAAAIRETVREAVIR